MKDGVDALGDMRAARVHELHKDLDYTKNVWTRSHTAQSP